MRVVGIYISVDMYYALDEILVVVVMYKREDCDYNVSVLVFAGLESLILKWLLIWFYDVCLISDCNPLYFYVDPSLSALGLPLIFLHP